MRLKGKVALVTGAGRNMGKATALELASLGADVVVNARTNKAEIESVVAECRAKGVRAMAAIGDVGSMSDVERIVKSANEAFGRVDIVVNMVGIRPPTPFLDISEEEWNLVLAVNLGGCFRTTKLTLPDMIKRRWGRIIHISGRDAYYGKTERAHCVAAKSGISGLTRAQASEFSRYGITVNCVVPGPFNTTRPIVWHEGLRNAEPFAGGKSPTVSTAAIDGGGRVSGSPLETGIPVGRRGEPWELAKLVGFLASDDAAYITGQSIQINGGAYYSV
ncbi:MAG: SDR family oxidoreductase [Dehalococcoidia bacterium]|nr:SDR family oxidoreductase [Dehalococcoidia bacterium]